MSVDAVPANTLKFDSRSFVESLPLKPGVYRMLDEEGEIFIGIVVTEEKRQVLLERLDNAAAEALAMVIGKRGGS